MNKGLWALIAAIIIVVGGVLIYNRNHKSNSNNSVNTTMSSNMSSTNSSAASNASSGTGSNSQSTNSVSIKDFAFSPSGITVKKGTKVTWTNNDSTTHTVTETDSQSGPNSGDLSPGGSYSFTFGTAGTYHYHCSIHTSMTGTVTVTE